MGKRKKGFWKKLGCILISASIILTGWTFFGSSSDATEEVTDIQIAEGGQENPENLTENEETGGETVSDPVSTDNPEDETKEENDGENSPEDSGDGTSENNATLENKVASFFSPIKKSSLLAATATTETTTYTETTYSGTTLEYVSASEGDTFTVKSGTTTIAENAFNDSNVKYLYFYNGDADKISSFGSQSSWPQDSTKVYCLGGSDNESAYTVWEFFTIKAINAGKNLIYYDDSVDSTTYTITYEYRLLDADGEEVDTVPISSETVEANEIPSGITVPSSYTDTDGTTYTRLTALDPTIVAATKDTPYTYTFQSDKSSFTITINYLLMNAAGTETVTTISNTIKVIEDATPSYTPDSTYTYSGTTYELKSGPDPEFVAATEDATYTYTYTAKSSGGGGSSGGGSSSGGSSSSGSSSSGSSSAAASSGVNTALTAKYQVIDGANQQVVKDPGPVRIVCNGELSKLTGIFVDGTRIDSSRYTLESGSTILTFTAGFMKLFSEGSHIVRFEYVDGYAETGLKILATKTTTTVTYKISSDGSISAGHTKDATPTTADGFDSRYMLCLAIFLLGAGSILLGRQKKLEAILAGVDEDE